jgi:hypothetical protein
MNPFLTLYLLNETPNYPPTVALNSPADEATGLSATPTLEFTGTDPEGDDVRYNVQIATGPEIQTYYFDASDGGPSDPDSAWSDEANAFDGNISTTATGSYAPGGSTSAGFLLGEGTNAPSGTSAIAQVRVRMYGRHSFFGPTLFANIYTDGLAESLGGVSINSTTAQWSNYTTLSTPSGGWTWAKIQALEVKIYENGSGDGTGVPARVEIEVTTIPEIDVISGTDAGFANTVTPADTDPFNSGEKVEYDVQAGDALSAGTYYWRVRGRDPNGSNRWGPWSATREFTVTSGTQVTETHTLDSLVLSAQTNTHTTDSLVKAEATTAHTTDSLVKEAIDTTHTTDSLVAETLTNTHTADSLVKDELTNTHTTDSLVFAEQEASHTIDSFVADDESGQCFLLLEDGDVILNEDGTKIRLEGCVVPAGEETYTHTVDSLVKAEVAETHTVDSLVKAEATATHTVDSLAKEELTNSHTTDSLVKAEATQTHTADSLVKAEVVTTHTTDSLVKAELVNTHTVDSLVKRDDTATHTVDALVKAETTATHTTDSFVKAELTNTHTVDSLVLAEQTTSHSIDSFVFEAGQVFVDTSVDSLVLEVKTDTHTVDSLVYNPATVTHTIDSLIKSTTDATHTIDSFVVDPTISGKLFYREGGVWKPVTIKQKQAEVWQPVSLKYKKAGTWINIT